jgi:hypothetical protein
MSTEFTDPSSPGPAGGVATQPIPAEKFSAPDSDLRVDAGKELRKNDGFSKALDKQSKPGDQKQPDAKKGFTPPGDDKDKKTGGFSDPTQDKVTAAKKEDKPPADPIAAKNAEDAAKKAAKPDEKKSDLGKRAASLLKDEDEDPAASAADDKKDGDDKAVTDAEIEEEMKTPKSAKSERRFRHLHSQWKAAEAKVAETAKQVAEKEQKLAAIEKQMQELQSKATQPDPEIATKLERLQMLERRHNLKSSEHVKNTFDARITRNEDKIYKTIMANGVPFKNMDEKQAIEVFQKKGGFREFSRKHPDLAEGILKSLPIADRQVVEAAMGGQNQLEDEKEFYLETESAKAKEYFEKEAKAAEEAKAKEPDPAKQAEAQKQAIENLKKTYFEKIDIFKDAEIPADASPEEKARLTAANKLSADLRDAFANNLAPASNEEYIDIALSATLAVKLKRENSSMKRELAAAKAEIEKFKNGSKTSTKGGALPASSEPKAEKPPATFQGSIDRQLARRGSA